MKQLLYISRTRLALDQWELNGILSVSRWNNARADLTGLLLHQDGGFLQLLEGPPSALDRAFTRISVDARHWNPQVLLERESTRLFPGWPMGFVQPHPGDSESEGLYHICQQAFADRLAPSAAGVAVTMLRAYYHIQSEAGAKLAA